MSKVLIFDLDDTLYPEISYVHSGFAAVAEGLMKIYGWDANNSFSYMKDVLSNQGRGKVFNALLDSHGVLTNKAVRQCVSLYRHHQPSIELSPEAKTFLSLYPIKPYLVTDGHKVVQSKKVEALGIASSFKKIYITHRYGLNYAKPSPYCFDLIRRLELSDWPDLIYVGDNPAKDFVSLNSLGAITVRVLTGEHSKDAAKVGFDGQFKINSINDLLSLLPSFVG